MRIIIDTDAMPLSSEHGESAEQRTTPARSATEAPIDAGEAPGSTGSSIAGDAGVVIDSGPPPDWLVEAIAAAESQGRRNGSSPGTDEAPADAGSGPDA